MKGKANSAVDDYISSFPEAVRKRLQTIRKIITTVTPEASESVSYGIVGYKLNNRPLVYFGGFKHHVSLFAAGNQTVAVRFAEELKGYIQSKGTIQFPHSAVLPEDLIKKIVQFRILENNQTMR